MARARVGVRFTFWRSQLEPECLQSIILIDLGVLIRFKMSPIANVLEDACTDLVKKGWGMFLFSIDSANLLLPNPGRLNGSHRRFDDVARLLDPW